jgi:hypothetical protein
MTGYSLYFEVAMGEKARSLIERQVSPVDERLRLLRDTAGPPLGTFGTLGFGVSGCEMMRDFHPLNSRLPICQLDLTLCVAGSDDPDSVSA